MPYRGVGLAMAPVSFIHILDRISSHMAIFNCQEPENCSYMLKKRADRKPVFVNISIPHYHSLLK